MRISRKFKTTTLIVLLFVFFIWVIINALQGDNLDRIRTIFELCNKYPNDLIKNIKLTENKTLEEIENEFAKSTSLRSGGRWSFPANNNPNKVAIIVPYRNRYKNLKAFLRYMHTYMMRKQLEYGIYLIEPSGELIFNRALLINIGYKEALKDYPDWNCFVFHDVDLLPESDENLYECHSQFPRQYAITISIYNYTESKYFKNEYMGGVTAFSKEQFHEINGYSNLYFGWGGEDDDVYRRCMKVFGHIDRLEPRTGRYFANCHKEEEANAERSKLLAKTVERINQDGLNTVKYKVKDKHKMLTFTIIKVSY